ncbi:hypothetical protein Droror1_Dr00024237, partial [Drosera rotundifolia]
MSLDLVGVLWEFKVGEFLRCGTSDPLVLFGDSAQVAAAFGLAGCSGGPGCPSRSARIKIRDLEAL